MDKEKTPEQGIKPAAEEHVTINNSICPSCGRCPVCGKPNPYPIWQIPPITPYPPVMPYQTRYVTCC